MNIKDLIQIVRKNALYIFLFTALITLISFIVVQFIPDTYKAEILLVPAEGSESIGLSSSVISQFGAVLGTPGIPISPERNDLTNRSLAVLTSRKFINDFFHRRNFIAPFMAGEQVRETGELEIDTNMYNPETNTWLIQNGSGSPIIPSDWEVYEKFIEILTVTEDSNRGVYTISLEWIDRVQVANWLNLLVSDLNLYMKQEARNESNDAITYLQSQVQETPLLEMQSVFYNLIEAQTQRLMLADIRGQYAFRVLDPAVAAEERESPNRLVVVASSTLFSFLLIVIATIYFSLNLGQFGKNEGG